MAKIIGNGLLTPELPAGIERWNPSFVEQWRLAVAERAHDGAAATSLATLLSAVILAAAALPEAPVWFVLPWLGAAVALSLACIVQVRLWRKAPADEETFLANCRRYSLLYLATGIVWGCSAGFAPFLNTPQLPLTLLALTAAAVTAGGVVMFPLSLRLSLIFVLLVSLPVAGALLATNSYRGLLGGLGMLGHTALILYSARLMGSAYLQSLSNRFSNAQLLAEISEAKNHSDQLNARLNEQLHLQRMVEKNLTAARDQAQEAARSKSEFLANMSHEIRTPMNGVLGMAELLMGTDLSRKQRHFARTIHRSGEALLGIINDILDFSKMEAGRLELHSVAFDLRQLIEDVGVMFAERAHRAQLELQCLFPAEAHAVYRGDADRLRQVLTNLVGNALKFTERGEVEIRVRLEPARDGRTLARFEVKDTGIGVPPDQQQKIFESFSQADNTSTRQYGGTGLGLAICKKLVELMGGEIGINSTPGRGSTFWFTYPMPQASPNELGRKRPTSLDLSGRRVLVADEHVASRDSLVSQLMVWKARAVGVDSAAATVAHLELAGRGEEPVDLLIFDRKLSPNALRFAMEIRRNAAIPKLKIIALGQVDNLAETGQWFDAGISSYLSKPVRQSELFDAIAEAFDMTQSLARTSPEAVVEASQQQLPRFSANVLAAEDNPVNQELVRVLLEQLGCRVTLAENGREAVEALTESPLDALQNPYDLVLMDCQMPIMDGFAATAAIREFETRKRARRIPIVALTANALEGDRERCLAAQMDDYLAKPFTLKQLATTMARWVPAEAATVATPRAGTDTPAAAQPAPPPQPKASDRPPAIDLAALNRIKGLQRPGAPSVLGRVIDLYFTAATGLLEQIRDAATRRDPAALEQAAHSLKSSSANLGATQLVELCRTLEQLGRDRAVDRVVPLVEELRGEYEFVRTALERERRKLDA